MTCVCTVMNEKPILERAFELARSGEYARLKELERALAKEGYAKSDPYIHSPSVRKQLRVLCAASWGAGTSELLANA